MQIFRIGTGSVNYGTAVWYNNNRMPENVCYVCTCIHACVKKNQIMKQTFIYTCIYLYKEKRGEKDKWCF